MSDLVRSILSDVVWAAGKSAHRLADRLWAVSDRLMPKASDGEPCR